MSREILEEFCDETFDQVIHSTSFNGTEGRISIICPERKISFSSLLPYSNYLYLNTRATGIFTFARCTKLSLSLSIAEEKKEEREASRSCRINKHHLKLTSDHQRALFSFVLCSVYFSPATRRCSAHAFTLSQIQSTMQVRKRACDKSLVQLLCIWSGKTKKGN